MDNIVRLFKSDAHMLTFALLYADTWLREDMLGITENLYHDKVAAEEWKDDLYTRLAEGAKDSIYEKLDYKPFLNNDDYIKATDRVRDMYLRMTK